MNEVIEEFNEVDCLYNPIYWINRIDEELENILCSDAKINPSKSQSQWTYILSKLHERIFRPIEYMHGGSNCCIPLNIPGLIVLNEICDKYIELCNYYCRDISLIGFTKLVGMNPRRIIQDSSGDVATFDDLNLQEYLTYIDYNRQLLNFDMNLYDCGKYLDEQAIEQIIAQNPHINSKYIYNNSNSINSSTNNQNNLNNTISTQFHHKLLDLNYLSNSKNTNVLNWYNKERVNFLHLLIKQKITDNHEEQTRGKLYDSNNPTGQAIIVNHDFGYNQGKKEEGKTIRIEITGQQLADKYGIKTTQ